MRLALISHTNAPWTPHYARHFQAAGHELLVVSFHPGQLDGVEVAFVGREPFSIKRGKFLFVTRVPRVRRILNRFKPDLVYAPYLISNGLTAALAWRGPLVLSTRGADGLERLREMGFPRGLAVRLIRWLCERADLVHAVSEEWRGALVKLGVPPEKTFVVPTGVDTELFTIDPEPHDLSTPHIVCLRKHEPLYRNDVVLRVLACLRDDGVSFRATFVGGGTRLDAHKHLADELGLHERTQFTGHLPYCEIPDLLRSGDVYISASLTDGTASTLLEAMSAGVFPVVTNIPANRPWIVDGDNGLMFEPGNIEAAADAVKRALANPQMRAVRARNRELVVGRADHKKTMHALLQRLESVV